jgi:hypothetical protein
LPFPKEDTHRVRFSVQIHVLIKKENELYTFDAEEIGVRSFSNDFDYGALCLVDSVVKECRRYCPSAAHRTSGSFDEGRLEGELCLDSLAGSILFVRQALKDHPEYAKSAIEKVLSEKDDKPSGATRQ